DEAVGSEIVGRLRQLGPELDTFAVIPPTALTALHMDPEQPVPAAGDGGMLSDLTGEAIDDVVETVVGSPLLTFELRHLGGALAGAPPDPGALASLEGRFIYFAGGIAPTPEAKAAVDHHVQLVQATLERWDAGRTLPTFTEKPSDPRRFFTEDTYRRLPAVRSRVDPPHLFRATPPI